MIRQKFFAENILRRLLLGKYEEIFKRSINDPEGFWGTLLKISHGTRNRIWVVGHSYIVYGPLLTRCTTILYEGKSVGTLTLEPSGGLYHNTV